MMQLDSDEPLGIALDATTVRIERLLPGSAERLWVWLTDPEKRAKWLAGGDMALHPGADFALVFRHSELSAEAAPKETGWVDGHVNRCRITRCEPPRLLSYSWPEASGEDSEVTFELTPQADQVLLVVTHRRLADEDAMVNVASGWQAHLGILMDRLNGRQPRGFWTAHAKAEAEYTTRFTAQ